MAPNLSSISSVDPAELLAHVAWVQRLARALVVDASAADDLAQETLRIGIERPPDATARGPRLRGWLARVARRLAIDRARSDARRAQREVAAGRVTWSGASPAESPLDVVERSARQQRVVAAVMALDEPFRSTVLLRFFDELPTRTIAARTGVNDALVRKRVERALAQLRERLDREFGEATKEWAGALLAIPSAAAMATSAKLAVAAALLIAMGGAMWGWLQRADVETREARPDGLLATAGDSEANGGDGAAATIDGVRSLVGAQDHAIEPRPPRRVVVEVVTPDGTPCREGALTAFWRRTPTPDYEELNKLLSHANHTLMTPRTEPLRTVERPIAGEQTELDFPSDLAELQIAASVAGRRPSLRVVLSDRATPGWERVRLVVDEPPPDGRFAGAITIGGERRVPRGLTIGVGANVVWPPPNHGARIDVLAASYEIEPRPEGDFHLWVTSDETVPCRIDIGASAAGCDLELEKGSTIELTLVDVARGESLPGVELLVKVGVPVITRWGDTPWYLQGEHTVAVRSDGEGRAIVATLPRTPPSRAETARGDRAGFVEVRLDRHPISADPLWKATLAAVRADPLQATLRLDLGRPHRRIHGSVPPACRGARFDGDPECTIAMARREPDASARREEKAVAIDGEGRFVVEVAPGTRWWLWAEREKQRLSEVAEVEVVADDVGPIELAPRRGSEVTLRVRGVAPPDTILLWVEDRASPVGTEECYLDVTDAAFERRLILDGPTVVTINRQSRSSARDRERRLTVDPATQSVVEVAFAAPTALRRIEFMLQGAKVPRPDPNISFMRVEPPPGPFDAPPASILLDAAGRGFHPVSLTPGRYLWSLQSRLHGVIAGIVDVEAAEPAAPLRIECEVEPAEPDALASGFVVDGFGEVDAPQQWRRMLSWRPGEGIDDGTPVWVPVDALLVLREPGGPVAVTLSGATLPPAAALHLAPLDGDAPFAFEFFRVELDASGHGVLPVPLTPGRWFWRLFAPLDGIAAGVVEVAAGARAEPVALHCDLEQRTGPEGRRGFAITRLAGAELSLSMSRFWLPRAPSSDGEAPFLVPVGAETTPIDPKLLQR